MANEIFPFVTPFLQTVVNPFWSNLKNAQIYHVYILVPKRVIDCCGCLMYMYVKNHSKISLHGSFCKTTFQQSLFQKTFCGNLKLGFQKILWTPFIKHAKNCVRLKSISKTACPAYVGKVRGCPKAESNKIFSWREVQFTSKRFGRLSLSCGTGIWIERDGKMYMALIWLSCFKITVFWHKYIR